MIPWAYVQIIFFFMNPVITNKAILCQAFLSIFIKKALIHYLEARLQLFMGKIKEMLHG